MSGLELDLQAEGAQPVQRFAAFLFYSAVLDCAESLEVSLTDIESETGTRFRVIVRGAMQEPTPAPGRLYGPIVVVLCNHAGIPYYVKGQTEGTLITKCPRSTWRLQSDNLAQSLLLSRILPPQTPHPPRKKFVKPNIDGAGFV